MFRRGFIGSMAAGLYAACTKSEQKLHLPQLGFDQHGYPVGPVANFLRVRVTDGWDKAPDEIVVWLSEDDARRAKNIYMGENRPHGVVRLVKSTWLVSARGLKPVKRCGYYAIEPAEGSRIARMPHCF